jgi:hypothetical protein
VIEALSFLIVAAGNRTQEISGEFRLAYRWLQPLDEQTQYYPEPRKDASGFAITGQEIPKRQ